VKLTQEERERYDTDGFFVRRDAFTPDEIERMRTASEELCQDLAAAAGPYKLKVSRHYVFELAAPRDVLIKWEPADESVIQGVEPCAHLHPVLQEFAEHPAMTEPCRDLIGADIGLFTEKLNVKRAQVGGSFALHQDYPYWVDSADDPTNVVTVWVGLDDATADNGALEVVPGSHRLGRVEGRDSELEFERNEIDPATFDTSQLVPVEVPAGTAIYFGPFLVHRSAGNTTDHDRRALLYSYQPVGCRTQREILRRFVGKTD
jgi:hypothetical protein